MNNRKMLPAEILDYLFSFLQNDGAALKSCSAAHPYLSSLAERHIFSHIRIIYFGISPFPDDGFLVCQLSERPYLANYVRSITIQFGSSDASYENLDELSTVLLLIQRSEKVSLCNIQWHKLPKKFRSAFLKFLRTPHMKGICLEFVDYFPLTILDKARNIKTLKVEESHCRFNLAHPTPTSSSLESLFFADVDNLPGFITWVAQRWSGLISLHYKHVIPLAFPDLSPIFNACLKSLTSLTLDIGPLFATTYCTSRFNCVSHDFPFNISVLACLEVVTIHAQARLTFTFCESSLPAITQLVRTAGPSLKRVVLNLDCFVVGAPDLRDVMEWEPLIQLCDSLAHLRVDLCILVFSGGHHQLSFVEVVDSLVGNEDLSRLVERGSLIIKPSDY